MKNMLAHIFAIAWKEWLQIKRDVISLLLAIWMPLLLLILFGTAITLDIKNIPVTVLDEDKSSLSREILDRMTSSNYFVLKKFINHPSEIDNELDSGSSKIALWLKSGFTEDFYRKRKSVIFISMDGADNNTARIASGYFQTLFDALTLELIRERMPISVKERIWFNPELKSTNFLIPGIMGIILIITCTVLTALSIVKEKERGTIEKLMVTPVRGVEIIIGKMLPYSLIAFTSFVILFLGGIFIFRIPFNGNVLTLFASALLSIIVGLSYGLFISTLTNNQQVAWMISMLTTLLPSMILSGFIFLIPSMPDVLQLLTYLVPARYIIEILRGIILKGIGFSELLRDIIPLFIMTICLIYLSTRTMKKRA